MYKEDFVNTLLEIYLQSRSPMPLDGYVPEFRTTVEIQNELEPMMHISGMMLVECLYAHGYRPTANDDDSPIWVIYRRARSAD